MNAVFSEDYLLTNETGRRLYENYARELPIIDYHCHLIPEEICENRVFTDLGEIWLAHDHYKWRAMRTFGVDEKYITGSADYHEKFLAFAGILPQLIGNPLFIWCALELKRYFGIEEPLTKSNAEDIYRRTKSIIAEKRMTPRMCMSMSNVEVACTTDDPTDNLEYHRKIARDQSFKTKIVPAFRPDKAFYCEKPGFGEYLCQLSDATGIKINSFDRLIKALEKRLLAFKDMGGRVCDIGIENFTWRESTLSETDGILVKALENNFLYNDDIDKYRSAFLLMTGRLYYKHNFVMQLHIGTYHGANRSKEASIGPAVGFDCTDDSTRVKSVGALLDRLSSTNALPKTILYPLDASNIENYAILAAAFCEGGVRAKVQLGAPWWFNDQIYGINRQFEAVSNLYPISLSVGMLTDSRSFLSYPRHELYRRALCSYMGTLVERNEYFGSEQDLKQIIQDICYYNAKEYFNW